MKIFDCFTFYNELDLLDIRLHQLWNKVDYFVIVEGDLTFAGKKKDSYYLLNKERYAWASSKIIHVIAKLQDNPATRWVNEALQIDAIMQGLTGASAEDIVCRSCVDEIYSDNLLSELRSGAISLPVFVEQDLYYYYLNGRCTGSAKICPGPVIAKFLDLGSSINTFYDKKYSYKRYPNGGWHFSFLGGAQIIRDKIEAYSHQEYDTEDYKDTKKIEASLVAGNDIFGREGVTDIEYVPLDSSFPKYIVENFSKFSHLFHLSENLSMSSIIFDQYSRYNACAEVLRQAGYKVGSQILEVGSGRECLFGRFVNEQDVTYVDPLIVSQGDAKFICGDVFSKKLDGKNFDFVTSVDVFEHVPPSYRNDFLLRLMALSADVVILAFPAAENPAAVVTDQLIDQKYSAIYGNEYPWLKEHHEYGLPSLVDTCDVFRRSGWQVQTVGHGHVPWLQELLGFVICVWDMPELKDVVLAASKQFNEDLAKYDFSSPHYRDFVIASRSAIPKFVKPKAESETQLYARFSEIFAQAKDDFFAASLHQLVLKNGVIQDLNLKNESASAWGKQLYETVVARDATVLDLCQKIQESANQTLKLSYWSHGLRLLLYEKIASHYFKIRAVLGRSKSLIRRKLAGSVLGVLVRHFKDIKRRRTNMVSLESLKKSLKNSNGRLIITFPIITWEFRWQRPQHIVSRLSEQGFSVLYLAMSLISLGRRFRGSAEAAATVSFNELAPNVQQIWLHSTKKLNVYVDPVEGDDLYNLALSLEAVINELKPKSIQYLVQFPGWWPVVDTLKQRVGGKVIFDCMDDHGGFTTNTTQALQLEHDLIKKADLVITSSALLADRCQQLNPHTIQVKNGTEFEHFAKPLKNGLIDHLADHPIIGYYGAISDWFDMEIVAYCARQRPDWNFVLIGATFGGDIELVKDLTNVHLLGEKAYKDLPGYLAYFDVCIIPFKIIPLTMATNPVKFYEYLSSGKPVVSVNLPELVPHQDNCYLAKDKIEFLEKVQTALNDKNNTELIERRIDFARENSWDSRVNSIIPHLESNTLDK